ncbi:unnamed protein product, partial [Polarella glacialis]
SAKRSVGSGKKQEQRWSARLLRGGAAGRQYLEIVESERKRRLKEYAPLDFTGKYGEQQSAASVSQEELTSLNERERAIVSVARAAHPFAALGFSAAEAQAATVTTVRQAAETFIRTANVQMITATDQQVVADGRPLFDACLAKVKAAARAVESMLTLDSFGAQRLAELYYAMDEEGGIMPHRRAASLLG